ncbi:hypothetical protein [Thiomicrorhabdus sp. Kp2]|uniref:hypothetical protein n=1 Tax=Thiomicrorhabdus sp. Kp2 TaxID=1123518 RepID=UPI0012FF3E15|nr:hypothetical protein [Thiomicrorhabdus sp. Kp2]
MNLEKTKVSLLSYSKNLVIASENQDWALYSVLESNWIQKLDKAKKAYGNDLNVIANELISDNQKIQENIQLAQKKLLEGLEKNANSVSSIKSYLK